MDLILAAILLSAPAAQTGEAQGAWDGWRTSLGTKLPVPVSLELEATASFDAKGFDPGLQAELGGLDGMRFDFGYRARMLDLRRFRVDLAFRGKLPDPDADAALMDASAEGHLLADGTTIHAWGAMDAGDGGGTMRGGARATQAEVEGLYDLMRSTLPKLMEAQGGVEVSGMMELLMSMYPESIGGYLHPCNYLRQAMPMFRASEFSRADGRVRAKLRLDPEHGPFAELIRRVEEAEQGDGTEAGKQAAAIRAMLARVEMSFVFDEATGVALEGRVAAEVPASLFDESAAGVLSLAMEFRAKDFSTAAFPAEQLAPPEETEGWLDADPFIAMAKMQLQSLAPDASGDDLEF